VKPRSLRLRLLGGAILWIGLALVLAGVAIGLMFVGNVERQTRADLTDSLNRLIAVIDPGANPLALTHPLADPRYDTPFSGLYWQVGRLDGTASLRSRSLWDFELAPDGKALGDGTSHFVTLPGPSGQSLSALVRKIHYTQPSGPADFLVLVAENRAVLDASIAQFGRDLIIALVLLGLVLLIAAWLQVRLGLTPLDSVRAGIDRIQRGESARLPEDFPVEVLPLVKGVNELLQSQEKSMQFARARAADLAHGLKTPLSVLSTVSERLAEAGDKETAGLIDMMTREMADRVDYQLRLSRLRMRDGTHFYSASLNKALARTIAVVEKTRDGENLAWSFAADEAVNVDIEQQDLIELVGVLLENAAKWAKTRVDITIRHDAEGVETIIADDGPGLTPEQILKLGPRGRRLDESKKGSGLGLSIATEIVEINGGTLAFDETPGGGLRVHLRLPVAGQRVG
jgi:signal transduction histidine kinase